MRARETVVWENERGTRGNEDRDTQRRMKRERERERDAGQTWQAMCLAGGKKQDLMRACMRACVRADVARGDEGPGAEGGDGRGGGGREGDEERHRKTRRTPNCVRLRKYSRSFRQRVRGLPVKNVGRAEQRKDIAEERYRQKARVMTTSFSPLSVVVVVVPRRR